MTSVRIGLILGIFVRLRVPKDYEKIDYLGLYNESINSINFGYSKERDTLGSR